MELMESLVAEDHIQRDLVWRVRFPSDVEHVKYMGCRLSSFPKIFLLTSRAIQESAVTSS